jgi:hypothetical protein
MQSIVGEAFQNCGKRHFKNREKTPLLNFMAAAASGTPH